MSIDFTGVTGIEDDYGNLTKITDASGRVLWKSGPSEATVTITGEGSTSFRGKHCCVTIDGVDYTTATTLAVPVGTVIACSVFTMSTYQLDKSWVKVNGVTVVTAESGSEVTYNYTVNGNVTINMRQERNTDKDRNGYITITET